MKTIKQIQPKQVEQPMIVRGADSKAMGHRPWINTVHADRRTRRNRTRNTQRRFAMEQ